ncbi:unnamed protein product [Phaedon cochleariae]|uniref:Gustatory receptor n=1 Tax=Phaedon cochleariae TaxID=80249 RepID=A0A9P0DTW1_PHACE|nr:unnamed protein product [Phaedon cochleariae]
MNKVLQRIKSDISITLDSDQPVSLKQKTFHGNISLVIAMAQFFGVMPLHNVRKNPDEVFFKWTSFRVFYAMFNAVMTLVSTILWIVKFSLEGLVVDKTAQMAFYLCNFLASVQLIEIARHWSSILREWSYIEVSMRGYPQGENIGRKFLKITLVFIGLGTVEHLLFILNGVFQSQGCVGYDKSHARVYFEVSFQNYFTFIQYNVWLAIIIKFANTISTFTWIFTDLFITLMSIALTARFKQINQNLENSKIMHEKFWSEMRQDYLKLHKLCKSIDKHLAFLVAVSYTHNIYFLCIQLYNSLSERSGAIETTYFFFSFGFLVLRLLTVSMYGAWLNEETKKPLEFLCCVHTDHYCIDVSRWIQQIYVNPIGISGSGFFLVTKNFLLRVSTD